MTLVTPAAGGSPHPICLEHSDRALGMRTPGSIATQTRIGTLEGRPGQKKTMQTHSLLPITIIFSCTLHKQPPRRCSLRSIFYRRKQGFLLAIPQNSHVSGTGVSVNSRAAGMSHVQGAGTGHVSPQPLPTPSQQNPSPTAATELSCAPNPQSFPVKH